MKGRLIRNFTIVLIALSLLVAAGCTVADKENGSRANILRKTGIEIPTDAKLVYYFTDEVFMHGRHPDYSVYKFETEPTDWLTETGFSNLKDEVNEKYFAGDEYGGSGDFWFYTMEIEDIPDEYPE